MGIAFGGRETFVFDSYGRVLNPQLRTYRPLHYGEQPEYIIEFVETPHVIAPYGARRRGTRTVGDAGSIGKLPFRRFRCPIESTSSHSRTIMEDARGVER